MRNSSSVALHPVRKGEWVRGTNPSMERTISAKRNGMGSRQGTINIENYRERIYKTRRKRYVVFYEWNQGKCANTSRERCRSSFEEPAIGNPRPTSWWSATTDRKYKHYKTSGDRIVLKDSPLFRKNYREAGSVKYHQILIPKQIVDVVLRSMHGEIGKHRGITRTIIAYRQKYSFPNMAQLITEWDLSCEQCITKSRIDCSFSHPHLQNPNEHITVPKDAMQIDFVPKWLPSGGH